MQIKQMDIQKPEKQRDNDKIMQRQVQSVRQSDSKLVQRYRSNFKSEILDQCEQNCKNTNFQDLFLKYDIHYYPQRSQFVKFSLIFARESINSQVVVLEARWGKFTTQINILNVSGDSHKHRQKSCGGACGKVYTQTSMGETFAIKCIPFNRQQTVHSGLMMAIKQIFILKVASVLKVGPQMILHQGFDAIVYQNCAQFAMQKCQQVNQIRGAMKEQLLANLLLMHKFGLVHYDIKPDNIMFSQKFSKIVFIDFGLSALTNIEVGEKQEIFFQGTLMYSSPEMVQCFQENQPQKVDIFFNDLFALKEAISWFSKNSLLAIEQMPQINLNLQEIGERYCLQDKSLLFYIKFQLFQMNSKEIDAILKKYSIEINTVFTQQILDFLYELNPNYYLRHFYQSINCYIKEGMQHSLLAGIYSSGNYKIKKMKPLQKKQMIFSQHRSSLSSLIQNNQCLLNTNFDLAKLLKDESRQKISILGFYRLYLDQISFSNNLKNTNMNQRIYMTKLLNTFLHVGFEDQEKEGMNLIFSTLIHISSKLLNEPIFKKNQKKHIVRLLIFDITQQLFIINFWNQQKILEHLTTVYESQLLDDDGRIEFLLKVKHYSSWILFRCNSNLYLTYKKVKNWFSLQLNLLSYDVETKYVWIMNYLCRAKAIADYVPMTQEEKSLLKSLSRSLQQELMLEVMSKNVSFAPITKISQIILELNNNLSNKQSRKTFFLSLYLTQIYSFIFQDQSKSKILVDQLILNLNSQEIFSQLIIYYSSSFKENASGSQFLNQFRKFIGYVDTTFITYHQPIVLFGLHLFFTEIKKQTYESKDISQIMESIQQLSVYFRINFYLQENNNKRKKHHCYNYNDLFNIFQIKRLIHNILQNYDFFETQKDRIMLTVNQMNCRQCFIHFQIIEELESQLYWIALLKKQRKQIYEEKINQSCLKVAQIIKKQRKSLYAKYLQMNMQNLFYLCHENLQNEAKFSGIKKLYQYVLDWNCISYYFMLQNHHMIANTMKILISEGYQKICDFMIRLTSEMMAKNIKSSISMLCSAFETFVNDASGQYSMTQLFNLILKNRFQSNGAYNYYNGVYYNYLIQYVSDDCFYINTIMLMKSSLFLSLDYLISFETKFLVLLLKRQNFINKIHKYFVLCERKRRFILRKILKNYVYYEQQNAKKKAVVLKLKISPHHLLKEKALMFSRSARLSIQGQERTYISVYHAANNIFKILR